MEQVQFADGTTWTKQQLIQLETTGTSAADTLYGSPGADTFDGHGGGDTFAYNTGYGALEINEVNSNSSDVNVLKLGAGTTSKTLGVTSCSANNVYLTDSSSGDKIKIDKMLNGASFGVQSVQFSDGTSLTRIQLLALPNGSIGSAKMQFIPGSMRASGFSNAMPEKMSGTGAGDQLSSHAEKPVMATHLTANSAYRFGLEEFLKRLASHH